MKCCWVESFFADSVILIQQFQIMLTAVKEINRFVDMLSDEEQNQLAKALRKKLLIAEADRLSRKRKSKPITMSEIVKEVRIVRKQRHALQSRR